MTEELKEESRKAVPPRKAEQATESEQHGEAHTPSPLQANTAEARPSASVKFVSMLPKVQKKAPSSFFKPNRKPKDYDLPTTVDVAEERSPLEDIANVLNDINEVKYIGNIRKHVAHCWLGPASEDLFESGRRAA